MRRRCSCGSFWKGLGMSSLPLGWDERSLIELGNYVNGFAFKPENWSEDGLPIVRIAQITGTSTTWDHFPGVLSNTFRIDSGDLIFSWSGTLAVVRWSGGPAWLNQHLFRVDPSPNITPDFLFHILSASVAEMDKRAHGSTMKHIKRGELREFRVRVPKSVLEQRKIAQILDTLDTQIRQTEALIAKLERIKQGLLTDLLTRGIDQNGQLRPTPDQAPRLYKDSPLGRIPKEWETRTLEDLAAAPICYGIVQVGTFVDDGIPVVAIKNLGKEFHSGMNRADRSIEEAYSRSRIQAGDVLISIKGTTGRVDVVPNGFTGNISRDIARIRPHEEISSYFLCHYLRSKIGQKTLSQAEVGTTRAELSIGPLRKTRAPVPSLDEQNRIALAIDVWDQDWKNESNKLEKHLKLKRGLMDDLLTGRVRVTPLLEEAQQRKG